METPLRSEFVALLMPGAPAAEIEAATRRWFAVLQVLDRVVTDGEMHRIDSREPAANATLGAYPPP